MQRALWLAVILSSLANPLSAQSEDHGPGLQVQRPGFTSGYTLYSPLLSGTTYLVDDDGWVVHTWESEYAPVAMYLRDNGNLVRTGLLLDAPLFTGGGQHGRIEEYDWDGNLVWELEIADEQRRLHHDIELLPNGNLLVIAWEAKTAAEAFQAGRLADFIPRKKGLWPDCVLEIEPTRPKGGKVVWEWHLWDHLVQDISKEQKNYGVIKDHPELVNINADIDPKHTDEAKIDSATLEKMKALGYVGAKPPSQDELQADLCHTNAISYDPTLDQIALSVHHFNEIWVIDHSTTTKEAASHRGGRSGMGGDLLYRWGNPRNYGRGTAQGQRLFGQHDVRWIPEGQDGAGNLTIFNNGGGRAGDDYSDVIEIQPPRDGAKYTIGEQEPFGPDEPSWVYGAEEGQRFFAPFISGAHRLTNGNTFICAGTSGRFFEVTPAGELVWELINPFSGEIRREDGSAPQPGIDRFPTSAFRATRLPKDHPAFEGRDLKKLSPQPEPFQK
ncbi:MAG: aryl-sulfate sulfotransferase [Planctomycetota bacterium]